MYVWIGLDLMKMVLRSIWEHNIHRLKIRKKIDDCLSFMNKLLLYFLFPTSSSTSSTSSPPPTFTTTSPTPSHPSISHLHRLQTSHMFSFQRTQFRLIPDPPSNITLLLHLLNLFQYLLQFRLLGRFYGWFFELNRLLDTFPTSCFFLFRYLIPVEICGWKRFFAFCTCYRWVICVCTNSIWCSRCGCLFRRSCETFLFLLCCSACFAFQCSSRLTIFLKCLSACGRTLCESNKGFYLLIWAIRYAIICNQSYTIICH